MNQPSSQLTVEARRASVDDCWNRIGVQGDGSCAQLHTHIHCRNCAVYSAAARQFLDVPLPEGHLEQWTAHFSQPRVAAEPKTDSVLILRCGSEWLALPTAMCVEVLNCSSIHTLPHRRNASVLGLVNVRGELLVCLSLAGLLGLPRTEKSSTRRLVVVSGDGAPMALEVDEAHGIHGFNARELNPLPATLATASSRHTCATLRWKNHTVGVLDQRTLSMGMTGSLA